MKLGSQTASVINHLHSRATIGQPVPLIGMGATLLLWTDRHAATITNIQLVRGKTIITVRRDSYKVVSGSTQDGSAEYECQPNPSGSASHWRCEPDGRWQSVIISEKTGRWSKAGERGLRIGERDEYRDPSF